MRRPSEWPSSSLKGGVALELRLQDRARATKDLDLEWQIKDKALLDALIEATDHDAGDFFTFRVERAGPPPERLGGSHRFKVSASLAGRPFEQGFALDVAPRNELDDGAVQLTMPDLLAFAGIEPTTVAAIPVERHIAEKLHAYTQTYAGGRFSTRVKDLVDLALLADFATLDARALFAAIDTTFDQRALHPLPVELPIPPHEWRVPFRELAQAVGIPTDLAAGHADAAALLDPILTARVVSGTWSPDDRRWLHRTPAAEQSR